MRINRSLVALLALAVACSSGPAQARGMGGGGMGGGGGRGFSGGSTFSSSKGFSSAPSYSAPSPTKGFNATPSAASRVIASPPATSPAASAVQPTRPTVTTTHDSAAQRATAEAQSQSAFRRAEEIKNPPRPVETPRAPWGPTPSASASPVSPGPSPSATQPSRTIVVERNYYNGSGGVDPYFWLWLMESNNNRARDSWIYNNRDHISDAQMEELRRRDRDADRRLRELESKGVARDPSATVPGVDDRWNGQVAAPAQSGGFLRTMGKILLTLLLLGAGIYFLFIHKYPTRRTA